ncbi:MULTISPECIES: hypothetical protein [Empedobacter]|uniref:Uncharacterized protein n=1 Tax=Empedobacter falsenii TaxID=343874 RepID=A0A376G3V8_9FLAO|nr:MULTISPECIES: hypothetical protein [Empedobacter]MBW1617864.1 hypothetical protein [Empedobacter falsenii]MDM1547729.1 hypothetical protein [Empedobacter falsenii]MDM1552150.1 hypothetical protein [Empedobacter falsenii]RRT87341.1 hypothetical protein EGI88_13385 [Empedobacter falsenii]RRT88506.1 hypothetical protein EGI89_13620 [Empedobacter falsenii]
MKNLFLLATLLVSSFTLANNLEKKESSETFEKTYIIEYKLVDKTCYTRTCWLVSDERKECTEWQEIPCDAVKVIVEIKEEH